MALTDESAGIPATMLVGPANIGGNSMPYPYPVMSGGNNGGFGGQDGWWIVLLIILLAAGNWGNRDNGGSGFGGGQPIIVNDGNGGSVQRGFDQAAIMSGIGDISNNIFGVQNSLCNGFASVNATVNGAQNAIAQQLYTNQISDLERSYAAQTASSQGMNALQSQLAQCCCDNRLATCQTQNIVQNEANATRFADANNTRDLLTNQTANTQAILDKLCQLELDGKNDRIADLERQLTMANLAASQTAQTSRLLADNAAQTTALEQYLNPVPIPAYIVQNPNCCQQNNCGCGGF